MAALVFPPDPLIGDVYPVNPGVSGLTQYVWDGLKWNTVLTTVSLGTVNQGAFNNYQWPIVDGAADQQLTTDGTGNLSWSPAASPALQMLSLLEPFDGVNQVFTLVLSGSTTPFSPSPSTNLIVFLGGVPQIPVASFTVSANTITFTESPLAGSTFYAITSIVL